MRAPRRVLPVVRLVLALIAAASLAACESVPRIPYTEEEQRIAEIPGMPPGLRAWADAPADVFRGGLQQVLAYARRSGRPPTLLALSGGADDGAYGAGLLNGWSKRGDRPEFTIVSGISTGALTAPFAFLGPEYDDELKEVFTEIDGRSVFVFRGLAGFLGPGLADPAPLRAMIDKHVTDDFLRRIAAEHAKGRRLIVVSTNLDAQRSVVWNMGRIAEVGTPAARKLFGDVLLASASVPAVFAPTLIEVEANGRRFQELHVDGGATLQVFTLPNSILVSDGRSRESRGTAIYMVINNRLFPDFQVVPASTIQVAARSLSTIVKSSASQTVAQTYDFARDRRIGFNLTYIGQDFDRPYEGPFNRAYMNDLFEYGYRRGIAGTAWQTTLPFRD